MDSRVDPAHLPEPLAIDQGESSWLCAELTDGAEGRFAVLAWLHRTGPRFARLDAGIGVLDHQLLPGGLRGVVPSWLPILTPVKVRTDRRPLLMIVLYDLAHPDRAPIQIEQEVEDEHFDPSTFSGATDELALRVLADRIVVQAKTSQYELELEARPTKPATQFGPDGPYLRHGDIEVGYYQRSRLALVGTINGTEVRGEGAHDRHWRHRTVPDLAWLWLHLRLDGEREVNAYVIRHARTQRELGRNAWLIDPEGRAASLEGFELRQQRDVFDFECSAISVRFSHAVARPHLPMRAFGEALVGGISEAPIRSLGTNVEGWLELFDATTCLPA